MTEVKTLPNGVNLYSQEAFKFLQEACIIAKTIMRELLDNAQEGNTTLELNKLAESLIYKNKCATLFKGYNKFPATICTSVNEVIVHGIPNTDVLKTGDVLSIDLGLKFKGYCSDHARTTVIGSRPSEEQKILLDTTKQAFQQAVKHAIPGSSTGTLGFYIHKEILKVTNLPDNWRSGHKFKVFTDFEGHGIGCNLHEKPPIPNVGSRGKGTKLIQGMCICIEPISIYKSSKVIKYLDKGVLQFKTDDQKPTCHYENQVFITEQGPIVLT